MEGGELTVTAPLVEKKTALAQFDDAVPWVNELFASTSGSHAFLTIELEDIEALHEGDSVQRALRACLEAIAKRDDEEGAGVALNGDSRTPLRDAR